ncbi:endonuclease/exonuclease/phosphatase family protein [Pseudooctadecabacter sp.]|uniref:endonuclease/exonuclease/phosphatase family protein n=1 Tax=Pseudooctadecabacter sp. TaxID=1966338 RepID=UPI0035C8329C
MWQWGAHGLLVAVLVLFAGSFAGALHPVGDSLAVFRPLIVIGIFLLGLIVRTRRLGRMSVVIGLVAGAVHAAGFVNRSALNGPADVTVYQKNLLIYPADRTAFVADVELVDADVVTLQEVSLDNRPLLEALQSAYPHQLLCDGYDGIAVAILSKTTLTAQQCAAGRGIARAETQIAGRSVQVYALHLYWPWPKPQLAQVLDLQRKMAPLDGGVTVVAGDFNMVARGHSLALIEAATQTQRVGPLVRTFSLSGYPLGIDHVLATGGTGDLEVRPLMGSDHYGVVARIGFTDP